MCTTALFAIAKLRNQSRCPSMDAWRKKMWCLCTMESYSASRKNEIMLFSEKWMELETIMLSEVSQTQMSSCVRSHLRKPKRNKTTEVMKEKEGLLEGQKGKERGREGGIRK
jgi:hypothetical protein